LHVSKKQEKELKKQQQDVAFIRIINWSSQLPSYKPTQTNKVNVVSITPLPLNIWMLLLSWSTLFFGVSFANIIFHVSSNFFGSAPPSFQRKQTSKSSLSKLNNGCITQVMGLNYFSQQAAKLTIWDSQGQNRDLVFGRKRALPPAYFFSCIKTRLLNKHKILNWSIIKIDRHE
jgi:hypothetical protein